MSNNAPHITICIGSRQQVLDGVDILNRLLDATPRTQPVEDDEAPNPGNAHTAAETQEEQLTPQQKAARTRAANKAAKETAAATPATPTPPAPTTPSAPASPPQAPAAAAPAGPIDDASLLNEAKDIHARLGMAGRGQEMINHLTQCKRLWLITLRCRQKN